MESAAKKKKHTRNFQEGWLKDPEFKDWLIKDKNDNNNDIMKCLICCEANVKNVFTTGCTDFQRSALVRHISSDAHRSALKTKSSRNSLKKSLKCAEEKASDSLTFQLKTVYFIVKNNIPLHTYTPLLELQKSNGCDGLKPGHYVSHDAVSEMVESLASSLTDDIKREIEASKFIGIMTDESCDIAIFKKLIIYVQTVVNGKINVSFAANLDVVDGKAETIYNAIKDWLVLWDIPVGKVMGLATDGAAVMTGVQSGVGVRILGDNFRLVHIHCVAHKLALAVSRLLPQSMP
ncbi:uncharacterized protein C17orf113-like [Mercenaria mercenaria]|uniref:uncharacterized protein C17orf113-like n=1 Tax=Mercenaria mercenaria TaxID=6596 RepID=UPI00234ED412|nr:uncharacterized protein C17orf113-like [Mercenaria mercenaria]